MGHEINKVNSFEYEINKKNIDFSKTAEDEYSVAHGNYDDISKRKTEYWGDNGNKLEAVPVEVDGVELYRVDEIDKDTGERTSMAFVAKDGIKQEKINKTNTNGYEKEEKKFNEDHNSVKKSAENLQETAPETNKNIIDNIIDFSKTVAATRAVTATTVVSGIGKVVEKLDDGINWCRAKSIEGASWLVGKTAGLINKDASEHIMNWREKYKKHTNEFIATDRVEELNKLFYEHTGVGKVINDNSALKYDSKAAKTIKGVTETVGTAGLEIAATLATGGAGGAIIGGINQAGKAAENTYQKAESPSLLQEGGVLLSGGLGALAGYATGGLGASAYTQASKSVANIGLKGTGAQLVKNITNKAFMKNLVVGASKNKWNYISAGMMSANDIGDLVTGQKEVNKENIKKLAVNYAKNLGLNFLINGFTTIATEGFKAPALPPSPDSPRLTAKSDSEIINNNPMLEDKQANNPLLEDKQMTNFSNTNFNNQATTENINFKINGTKVGKNGGIYYRVEYANGQKDLVEAATGRSAVLGNSEIDLELLERAKKIFESNKRASG